MEIVHDAKPYNKGGAKIVWDDNFDFLLFRQDWGGAELIYFNRDELEKVYEMIGNGEIILHMNYSILVVRDNIDPVPFHHELGIYATTSGFFKNEEDENIETDLKDEESKAIEREKETEKEIKRLEEKE